MELFWTKHAKNNLDQIYNYIADENERAATKTISNIINSVEILRDYPLIGRKGRIENTRELIIANMPYIVPYQIYRNIIYILRVLHSAKQWPTRV